MLRSILSAVLFVSILGLLSSCAGDGSGIPSPVDPGCNGLEPRLECIQEMILTPSCALSGCHDTGTASLNLILEAGFSHSSLSGRSSVSQPLVQLIEPGSPDDSFLVIKLEASDPRMAGSPMPRNSPALSASEIQAIRDWIANGALDD